MDLQHHLWLKTSSQEEGLTEKTDQGLFGRCHYGNSANIVQLLKACTARKDLQNGSKLHAYIQKHNWLGDTYVGSTLVSMYAKCGALARAQQVLKELPIRHVVSWSALIAGYAQHGQGEKALKCFDDMLREGHTPDTVSFTCALKACGSIRAASRVEEIHEMIVSMGMLEKDIVLGTTLMDMYMKCGALAKAQQVLEELPNRDVISWSVLIGGYAQQGQGDEALKCFNDMLHEGHSPNAVTFACVVKACGSIGAAAKGEEIHGKTVTLGMLEKDVVLGNSVIDMYVKCGSLAKAQQVLEGLPFRDVVSWNILIAGYAQKGQGKETLKCFDCMLHEGCSADAVTFASVLKACGSFGEAAKGEEIHTKMVSLGMLKKDPVLGTALVDMYVKCGALVKAHQVLRGLPVGDAISWSALISGYALQGQGGEALKCFEDMLQEGCSANAVTFMCALKACGSIGAVAKGEEIHYKIMSSGMLEKDVMLGNSLVNMYVGCGELAKAHQLQQELPIRDVISWNALIAGYAQKGQGEEALKCFNDMGQEGNCPTAVTFACVLKACGSIGAADRGREIHEKIMSLGMLENDIVLGNTLMHMYVKCSTLFKAQEVLKELPMRDVVSWSVLISGYAQRGQGEEALKCFDDMLREGHSPNVVTFICILKACGSIRAAANGEEVHDRIVSLGMLDNDIVLGNSLVDMYVKCGALTKAQQVLEELPIRDVVSWHSLIAGYSEQGQGEEAWRCFDDMLQEGHPADAVTFASALKACGSIRVAAKGEEIHAKVVSLGMLKKDLVLGTSLLDMYAKCGALAKAQQVLEELPFSDVVSWSALISGYAQQGQGQNAIKCFDNMLWEGHSPNAVTFICVLKAYGSIGVAAKGEDIHDKIVRLGMLEKDVVLGNSLIDMYIKCGALAKAQQVQEELSIRDVVSWNALVAGYAQKGQAEEALKCFDDMLCEGHSPTMVTFACVLKACGVIGAAARGEEIHDKLVCMGMLEKEIVLGNILVNMYVKCSALAKAQQVLEQLPTRDVVSWTSLIAAYAQQGQGEEALKCFNDMLREELSPNAVTFVCVLKACGGMRAAAKGEEIHDKIVTLGMLEKDDMLMNALVDMYMKCGALAEAQQVLEELTIHGVASWNALIAGFVQQGKGLEALKCFDDMLHKGLSPDAVTFACVLKACGSIGAATKGKEIHAKIVSLGMLKNDLVLGTSLVDMYAKCGAHAKAQQVIDKLPVGDVVSWTALISGYAQRGQTVEAIHCFERMQSNELKPNLISLTAVLNACSHSGLLDQAETYFSGMSTRYSINPSLEHYCCMTDVFARAGKFNKALSVIAEMPYDKCLQSWVTLLGACRKGADVKIGRIAFEYAHDLDKGNGAVYDLMADIYTAAGMQEDAHKVEVMGMANKAC